MARSSHWLNARSMLTMAVAAMLAVALLPGKLIGWVAWVSQPVIVVAAPVQKPMRSLVEWIKGTPREESEGAVEAEPLRQRIKELETQLLAAQARSETLERQLREITLSRELNPEVTQLVPARIIGGGADLSGGILKAKAGKDEGVEAGSVAVAGGVNLVGRVTRVEKLYSFILPITAKASGLIEGVIMLSDQQRGPRCQLGPAAGGLLRGRIDYPEGQAEVLKELKAGMVVRLDDATWPSSARMLVIGVVEGVAEENLHHFVTVKPAAPPDRVSELLIRVQPADAAGEGGKPR
jgi:cell shape-determining protein MreC